MIQRRLIHQLAEALRMEHVNLSLKMGKGDLQTDPTPPYREYHTKCTVCDVLRQAEEASVIQDDCACYPSEAYDES